MTRQAFVHRIATRVPDDVSSLEAMIASGAIRPPDLVAILGKTEGNGCVNDFTRGFASRALKDLLRRHLPPEQADAVCIVMSGGTEGALSPHIVVFERRDVEGPPEKGALALGRARPTLALVGAALLLASLGLVDHAAMQTGAVGALHRANDALHLLATAAWLGGLPMFALCLGAYRDSSLSAAAVTAMRRFSFWGQFDVALVVLTGFVNVALIAGLGVRAPTTPYRMLLAAKLVLVATMVALALFNRYVLAPRLAPEAPALRTLMKTSLAEVALGAAVVALVSLFGLLDPN